MVTFTEEILNGKLHFLCSGMKEGCFLMFRRLQYNITSFLFHKQHFYVQQQAEIWFEIIAISDFKRSLKKKKHFKWKTC